MKVARKPSGYSALTTTQSGWSTPGRRGGSAEAVTARTKPAPRIIWMPPA
ncbi:MAG: hypothetical protein ACK5XD_06700 [Acidobacteriota bacterium]